MHVDKDHAYLLHLAPYRDNSALAHLLTQTHGKVSFIISGLKSPKSQKRALLQPCQKLDISYTLKANLSKLIHLEANQKPLKPDVSQFMFYQYVHELLLNILPNHLPAIELFESYEIFLQRLQQNKTHSALRRIELDILEQFASLPNLTETVDTHQTITKTNDYYLFHEYGITESEKFQNSINVSGANLLATQHLISGENDETLAQGAQIVTTYFIKQLLGNKPLKTRSVFGALQKYL